MGDYIALAGFDGRALLLLLIFAAAVVFVVRVSKSQAPARYVDQVVDDALQAHPAEPGGPGPEHDLVATRTADDAQSGSPLLVPEADIKDLLRTTRQVDPPLYVWDRVEAAINRRPPMSVDDEWERAMFAVVAARLDFGGTA